MKRNDSRRPSQRRPSPLSDEKAARLRDTIAFMFHHLPQHIAKRPNGTQLPVAYRGDLLTEMERLDARGAPSISARLAIHEEIMKEGGYDDPFDDAELTDALDHTADVGTIDNIDYHASDEDDVTETITVNAHELFFGTPANDTVPGTIDFESV